MGFYVGLVEYRYTSLCPPIESLVCYISLGVRLGAVMVCCMVRCHMHKAGILPTLTVHREAVGVSGSGISISDSLCT